MSKRQFSKARRLQAFALAAMVAAAALAPVAADARAGRGSSFGSRGSKTFSAPPPTATMPNAAPMQRSVTQPGGVTNPGAGMAQQAQRRGMFGGFGGGLLAGFLGAGLLGMLFGGGLFSGLGSLSSIIGLLIQVVLIVIVARFVMGWLRRRNEQQQPAAAGAGSGPSGYRFDGFGGNRGGSSGQGSGFGGGGFGSAPAPLTLEKEDFDVFERTLGDVQEAYSAQDLSRLRGLATPEMVETFSEDLSDDASRGVVNKISEVKLLQGDLAEAWQEGPREYATVAMRYELIDVTEDRATGRVVQGDPSVKEEAAELWTFVRAHGGKWLLAAIQQPGR